MNNLSLKRKPETLTIIKPKIIKKNKSNNKKAARMRRQRGYHWEDTIVKTIQWREKMAGI